MSNWLDLLTEVKTAGGAHDRVRRKYLKQLSELTGRNTIAYYSGWLQKSHMVGNLAPLLSVHDMDKNGFMATIHELDRSIGLDLILHSPGGSIAATESIIDYLHQMFSNNIRAIIPQLAMSGGTIIALSTKEIIMGKHSNLGPIDPQIGGLPAHGILEEWKKAREDVELNPVLATVWNPILQKYSPSLIGECEKAIKWSNELVKDCLVSCMFEGDSDAGTKADKIVQELGDHALTLSHGRHISFEAIKNAGIKVMALEDDPALQDAVLCVHHTCIQTLGDTPAFKIIENHNGVGYILGAAVK